MQNYWGVDAASQICLRFSFCVRSFGIALCSNSKDYWCQNKVAVRTFLAIGKTSVTLTILIWCLPTIHDSLLFCTSMHLTADWEQLGSSFFPSYCTRSSACLCSNLSPGVAFVNGNLSVRVLMDVKLRDHQTCSEGLQMWTVHQECLC